MKSYDFEAVVYDGAVYCADPDCLPEGVNIEDEDVSPIFADAEVDCAPVCENCGTEHDYMSVRYRRISESDAIEQFNAFLDEAYGNVFVAGMDFPTSRVLKELDPTAYRYGMLDWADSEGYEIE